MQLACVVRECTHTTLILCWRPMMMSREFANEYKAKLNTAGKADIARAGRRCTLLKRPQKALAHAAESAAESKESNERAEAR